MCSTEDILAFSIIFHLVGWPFLDLTRQEITKKVKLRDTFSLGSQEDIIKVQLKCFLPEVLFLGLSFLKKLCFSAM